MASSCDQPYEADIQINLVAKERRKTQSHDIAQRIRPAVQDIGRPYGANVKVVEVPPGPPVQSVLVAEIYGPDYERQIVIARDVRKLFETTAGVVDVDDYLEADQVNYVFTVDRAKAADLGLMTSGPASIGNCSEIVFTCENGRQYPLCPRAVTVEGEVVTASLRTSHRDAIRVRLIPMGVGYRYAGHGIWLDGFRENALLNFGKHGQVACTIAR